MPAGIWDKDTMFSVRERPWHGLGSVLPKPPKTIDEALKKSGLDWDVIQRPVIVSIDGKNKTLEDYFVNIRTDTMEPLGVVTGRYTPVANRDAFAFLANIFGSEMHFETAGSLMNGRRVWVMMTLPEHVEVGGDPIGQYAFINNSHDGKSSVLAALTPIRIVCANTLGAALHRAKGCDAQRTYTIRHLGNMSQKIAEARNVLDVTINYYKQFKVLGDGLAVKKLSDQRAKKACELLFPTDESMGDRAAANREEARRVVMQIFKEGHSYTVGTSGPDENQDTRPQNALGTVWAWYNAAVEFADHGREERKEGGRFQRSLDDPDGLKGKSFEIALDLAGVAA